jgi:hypothetical protein
MAKDKKSPLGELTVDVNGKTYRLHFGMSVIADLQAKYGEKVEAILTQSQNVGGLPDMAIVVDIFLGALQRHHADEADRWLVDDIVSANANLLPRLMGVAFPDTPEGDEGGEGNGKAAA